MKNSNHFSHENHSENNLTPGYSATDTEPVIILLNGQLMVTEINETALTEFFHQKKSEILKQPFATLLIHEEINEKEVLAQIKHSEHSLFHRSKLYQPRTKKSYELSIICTHLGDQVGYTLILNACHPESLENKLEQQKQLPVVTNLSNSEQNNKKPNKATMTQLNKILLVEDHPIATKVTKAILSALDCEVDTAKSGKIALECVEKNHYDLIFMDVGLPDIDGCTVAEKIRSHRLESITKIPIIALTAHAQNEEKQRCLDIGMNMVITKPLTKEWAKSVLDTFIPKRKRYSKPVNQMKRTKTNKKRAQKIIDIEYAKTLLGGNETLIYEMLTMLVNSFPEEIKALEEAYRQKNWQELSNLAHKLKGGSSYCGTLRLKSACAELDNSIKSDVTEKIPDLYEQVLSEIEAVQKFMNEQSPN